MNQWVNNGEKEVSLPWDNLADCDDVLLISVKKKTEKQELSSAMVLDQSSGLLISFFVLIKAPCGFPGFSQIDASPDSMYL